MTFKVQHLIGFGAGGGGAAVPEPVLTGTRTRTGSSSTMYGSSPSTSVAGDQSIIQFCCDGTTGNPGNPTGNSSAWVGVNEATSSTESFTVKCMYTPTLASGDVNDTTLGMSLAASRQYASVCVTVTGVLGTISVSADLLDTTADTSITFNSRTPGNSGAPAMFVGVAGNGDQGTHTFPSNMPNGRTSIANSSGDLEVCACVSDVQAAGGGSFTPGTVSFSTSTASSATTACIQ